MALEDIGAVREASHRRQMPHEFLRVNSWRQKAGRRPNGRMVSSRGRGEGRWESLNGDRVSALEDEKCFGDGWCRWSPDHGNVLDAPELYAQEWLKW